ncbi:MAG: 3-deoxy-manno-octulosonate cytidylyltransferase [Prevotellaceae bacterium]|nr:3-deoxy-manno-octulosonate cytidylyltransferase [Prevotellaceae bacterium]
MKFLAIIPARYGSSRFPGKPLAMLGGKHIIQRVYERVQNVFEQTLVATDDERILQAVEGFGGKAIMTSSNHRSGTDRCWEAYVKSGIETDIIINVQGDEPFISSDQLRTIQACFNDTSTQIATLVKPFTPNDGIEALRNPNSPKVVVDSNQMAIYFSRSVIPFLRDIQPEQWLEKHTFFKHIGLYAYRTDVLREITLLPQGNLEKAESLEQLRWLENGFKIKVGTTNAETIGIDTPEDLRLAEQFLSKQKQ